MAAQAPVPALEAALARIPPGSTVRVQTQAGDVLEGVLRLSGDSVVLEAGAGRRAIGQGDVRSVWYPVRTTRTGAVVGALAGGGAGGAFMGLLALVAGGSGGEKATMVGIGVLGGAAAGGLLGGVVGAAVPHWVRAFPAGDETPAAAPEVTLSGEERRGRRRIGALEASLGYGRIGGDEPTDGAAGARIALHAEFGADPALARGTTTFLAVGPEVGWFGLGSTDRLRRRQPSGDTLELARDIGAFTAGGVLRLGLATGVTRTYAVLGLAYNQWRIEPRDVRWLGPSPEPPFPATGEFTFEHLGYSLGAGAQIALRPTVGLGLELRRTAVGTFDMDLPGSYWTVTIGGSRRW